MRGPTDGLLQNQFNSQESFKYCCPTSPIFIPSAPLNSTSLFLYTRNPDDVLRQAVLAAELGAADHERLGHAAAQGDCNLAVGGLVFKPAVVGGLVTKLLKYNIFHWLSSSSVEHLC